MKSRRDTDDLSIGELARLAGLTTSAIRYYESAGVLPVPQRRSGRRVYDESAVRRLALIRLAQSAGFTIAEIRTLTRGFARATPASQRWRALAGRKRVELRAQIERARAMERVLGNLLECRCPTLEDCGAALTRATRAVGPRAEES